MSSLLAVCKIRILGVVGFMAAGLILLTPAGASAIEQGGIGGRPAHPKPGNPRSQSIFVHTLQPGQQAGNGVEVINNTPETKRILVYSVDSQTSSGGAFACAQAADKPLSVGSWIKLDQQEVTLAAGAKQVVDFTIQAPRSAAPGEHNGCVVIQDTKQEQAQGSNGIVLSLRSAIRVAIRVPGDIQKGLSFTGLGLENKGSEKLLLSTALKNNGNVSLDTELDVQLRYPFGGAANETGGNFPVLANSEGRYNFETGRPFWGGWYRLTATARYNDNPNVSLGEGTPTTSLDRSMWVYIAPEPVAAAVQIVLLTGLIGGAIWLVRRRAHHRRVMRSAKTHVVKAGEDLHTIAETYNMPWKRLSRLNKLKPPYQLKVGQKLIVTPPPRDQGHKRRPHSRP